MLERTIVLANGDMVGEGPMSARRRQQALSWAQAMLEKRRAKKTG